MRGPVPLFFGTSDPDLNVRRVRARDWAGECQLVPARTVRRRWRTAQGNLVRVGSVFSSVRIFDSTDDPAVEVVGLGPSGPSVLVPEPRPWVVALLAGIKGGA